MALVNHEGYTNMQGDSWTIPANDPATGTSDGQQQQDSGQRVARWDCRLTSPSYSLSPQEESPYPTYLSGRTTCASA